MSRKRSEEAIEAYRPRFVDGLPRQRHRRGDRARDLRQARRLLGLRVPEVARGGVRRCSPTSRPGCGAIYPAEFLCALLNAQPMGFYPPSSLVRDAQRRGVEVRPPHINDSEARCSVEDGAVRVGVGYVQSVGEEDAETRSRPASPYARSRRSCASSRGAARMRSRRSSRPAPATTGGRVASCSGVSASPPRGETSPAATASSRCRSSRPAEIPELPEQTSWERMLADYQHTSLSVGVHPLRAAAAASAGGRRDERRAAGASERRPDPARRARDRTAAPVDGERDRLHVARGRAWTGQPDRSRRRSTSVTVRSSAVSRCCSQSASSNGTIATSTCSCRSSPHSARSPAERRAKPRSREPSRAPTTSGTADRPVCDRQVSSPRHRWHPTPARRMSKRCALEPRRARPVDDSLHPRDSAVTVPGTGAVPRSVVAGVRVGPAPVGPLVDRPDVLRQVVGGVDEADVRERLREVAEQALARPGRTPPTAGRGRSRRRAAARTAPAPPRHGPSISSASTSQNEHGRNTPSPPLSPSTSFRVAVR